MFATKWIVAGVTAATAAAVLLYSRMANSPSASSSTCDESLRAVNHGGTRDLSTLNLIVLHSTEGATARSAAGWFTQDASPGSAHYVVDDVECYHTLPDNVVPNGAKGGNANLRGLHIEIAGFARDDAATGQRAFTRQDWLDRIMRLKKAAAIVYAWGQKYGIPMRFVDAAGLLRGESGVTTHLEITKAFKAEGGHVDPGTEFPYDVFMRLLGSNAYGYAA